MSSVAAPTAEEEARQRLAAKAEKATAAALEDGDRQTVADIERLPLIAEQIVTGEEAMRKLYDERDAAVLRLLNRADVVGRRSHLSQSVAGYLAGGSKSLAGRIKTDHQERMAAATAKRRRGA